MCIKSLKVLYLFFVVTSLTTFAFGNESKVKFDSGGYNLLKLKPLVERQAVPEDVAIAVWPSEIIDAERTHYLNQNSITSMILTVANPTAKEFEKCWIVFDLPVSVELKLTNNYLTFHLIEKEEITREGKPYIRYRSSCSVHPTTIPRGRVRNSWFSRWRPPTLWLYTKEAVGSEMGKAYYRFKYLEKGSESAVETKEGWVNLSILPEIQAEQPKLVKSGAMGRFILNWPNSQSASDTITSYIKKLGFNYFFGGQSKHLFVPGLERWIETNAKNGFEINMGKDLPPDIRFVGDETFARAACPVTIYKKHPWISKHVFEDYIQEHLIKKLGVSRIIANWEPYKYLKTGCRDERCREEFIRWSKLPADDIRKTWPLGTANKYKEQWKAFKNWQLGQITKVYSEVVVAAGKEAGVKTNYGIWMGNDGIWGEEICPIDIEFWGDFPYDVWTWNFYYVPNSHEAFPPGTDRLGSPQVVRSGSLVRHLDKKFGPNRDNRFGMLYEWDQTGGGGFYLPEQLAFLHLSTVLAGVPMVQNYAEWTVWDGRYANEIANANTRIARWEDYIVEGKKEHHHVVVPVTPYPQKVSEDIKPREQLVTGPWAQPEYIFSYEYVKADKRLITVGNTWDFGECFFKLRVFNLDSDRKYVLSEPEKNRCFGPGENKRALSARELAQGVVVHVGAARWGAFLIEPFDEDKDYGIPTSPAQVREAINVRYSSLSKSLKKSKELFSREKRVQEKIKYIGVLNEAANVIGRDMVTELEKQSSLTRELISRKAAQSVSRYFASPTENSKKLIETLTKKDEKKAIERLTDIVGRVAIAKKRVAPPQLDGKLDDPCWRKAVYYNNFGIHLSLEPPRYKTSWATVYKDNTLYLGVDCKQDMTLPVVMALGRDGNLWHDDSIEIFLNQSNPMSQMSYLQIIVNANGEIFDSYNEVVTWNEIEKAKVFKSKDGWSFELAIPLDKIDVDPSRNQVLRINVTRNVTASKYNTAERSKWFPVSSANSDLLARGWLFLRE